MKQERGLFGCLGLCVLLLGACSSSPPVASESRAASKTEAALSTAGTTESADALRTAWYPNQPDLSPSLVKGGSFGLLPGFPVTLTGQVYAQPLLANGTLFVATETNDVYGLNPETGATFWHVNLGTPFNPAVLPCADLTPNIGVTGTPVIDAASNTAYLFSKTTKNNAAEWDLHALDVATGAEKPSFPVKISGNANNDATVAFEAAHHMQRPGLLLMNGVVYGAFSAHCDVGPFRGWIVGVSTAGVIKTLWATNPQIGGAGIWQSGGGIVSDGAGRMFVATGNGGGLDGPIAGTDAAKQASLGEAIVRVDVQGDGTLRAGDFFSPYDAQALDSWDADFAAGGPVGLPDSFGTATYPHLLAAVGKEGYVYLLNRDSLGGIGTAASGDAALSRTAANGGVWSKPAVWSGEGGYLYVPTASTGNASAGSAGVLYAYKPGTDVNGHPTLNVAAKSKEAFGFSSSRPIITSDGTTAGSGVVWIVWAPDRSGVGAQLRAYNAVPNAAQDFDELFRAPVGTSAKFTPPGVGDGRIYVGTREGKVFAYGAASSPALSATAADFGTVVVGDTPSKVVTITANQALTITSVTVSDPAFTVSAPAQTTLAQGQTTTVTVSWTPKASGLAGASLTIAADQASISTSLTGKALAKTAELSVSPSTVSFGGTTLGMSLRQPVVISNTGATDLTITGFGLPKAPFATETLPAAGTVIASNTSLTIYVTFNPPAVGKYVTGTPFSIQTSAGNVNLSMSGICGAPGKLVVVDSDGNPLSPLTIDFGRVAVGGTRSAAFGLSNTGGIAVALNKSKEPALGKFNTELPNNLPEELQIAANQTVFQTIDFHPTTAGKFMDSWQINGSDASGVQEIDFVGEGIATGSSTFDDPCWQLAGSAVRSEQQLVLSDLGQASPGAGSAFCLTAMPSANLDVSFDVTIGTFTPNPTPYADGMTLTFANAVTNSPPLLGAPGGALGFAGIDGLALAFDTFQDAQDPSANFLGLTKGPANVTMPDALSWLSTSVDVVALATTPPVAHHVRAFVAGGVLTIDFDDKTKLTTAATNLPSSVFIGFTDGTGSYMDRHAVSNISVVSDLLPSGGAGGSGGASSGGSAGAAGASNGTGGASGGDATGGSANGGTSTGGSAAGGTSTGTAGTLATGGETSGSAGSAHAGSTSSSSGSSNAGSAGSDNGSGSSGCGCRMAGEPTQNRAALFALGLGLVLAARRRRAVRAS